MMTFRGYSARISNSSRTSPKRKKNWGWSSTVPQFKNIDTVLSTAVIEVVPEKLTQKSYRTVAQNRVLPANDSY